MTPHAHHEPVVFTAPDGRDFAAQYWVDGAGVLHVHLGQWVKGAPLRGSKPDVLAHVLLGALLDELEAQGIDVEALAEST